MIPLILSLATQKLTTSLTKGVVPLQFPANTVQQLLFALLSPSLSSGYTEFRKIQ